MNARWQYCWKTRQRHWKWPTAYANRAIAWTSRQRRSASRPDVTSAARGDVKIRGTFRFNSNQGEVTDDDPSAAAERLQSTRSHCAPRGTHGGAPARRLG